MFVAIIAAVAGAATTSAMSSGGGGTAGGTPSVAQMPNQAGVAANYQNAITNYGNTANQFYGTNPSYANQTFNNLYNNPYAFDVQNYASQAGQMAGNLAPGIYNGAYGELGAGQQALGAGQQVYNTALDPQNALYNQMLAQTTNQVNATNSQYGIGGSAAGAGVANQAETNFNIDWQNQQLARQAQGAQALNAGTSAYTNANIGANNIGNAGINMMQNAGQLPYNMANTIGTNQNAAITGNQQAMFNTLTPQQQQMNDMQSYLGLGQAGQAQMNSQAYQQQMLQQQNNAANANLIYQGMNSYFGSNSGGSTYDPYASSPSSNPNSFDPNNIYGNGGTGGGSSSIMVAPSGGYSSGDSSPYFSYSGQ